MEDKFLLNNGFFYIDKVYKYLNEKELYVNKLVFLLSTTYYNEFHYSVLKFAKKHKLKQLEEISQQIIKNIDS